MRRQPEHWWVNELLQYPANLLLGEVRARPSPHRDERTEQPPGRGRPLRHALVYMSAPGGGMITPGREGKFQGQGHVHTSSPCVFGAPSSFARIALDTSSS